MRILQIVPLITPENAYGGPITVALGQCRALRDAGHEVILAGGTWGYGAPPDQIDGVRTHLFPARATLPGSTLGGLTSPRLLAWLPPAAAGADVVHVHLARDLLTLPAAMMLERMRVPYVVQTHGMVVDSDSPLRLPLDTLMTKRVLREAGSVFYLTGAEYTSMHALFRGARLKFLRNGITLPLATGRGLDTEAPEVLFLARVQARKRPLDFVAMAATLAPEFPHARFRMIGPDEEQGDAVREAIAKTGLGDRLVWDGPLPPAECGQAMAAADLYVLPSVNEPYPMSVLEALSHGLPVVITDSNGLGPMVREHGGGVVTNAGAEAVTDGVRSLLADRARFVAAGKEARDLAETQLGMSAVVEELVTSYDSVRRRSPRLRRRRKAAPVAAPSELADRPKVRPNVYVVIASAGRPEALARILRELSRQTLAPPRVVVSVPDDASRPAEGRGAVAHEVILAPRGSSAQRNAALELLPADGVVVFFDDDALPREDYLERTADLFAAHPDVVGATGRVVADGVRLNRALSESEMRDALASSVRDADMAVTEVDHLYGCNMSVRLSALGGIRFDERLPLYGWLEDLDLTRRVSATSRGRLVKAGGCVAAHQGIGTGGRDKHTRFGYSAIVNPVHLARKGSVQSCDLVRLIGRPLAANVLGCMLGPEREWRRERLVGMGIGAQDLLRGRITPERAADL